MGGGRGGPRQGHAGANTDEAWASWLSRRSDQGHGVWVGLNGGELIPCLVWFARWLVGWSVVGGSVGQLVGRLVGWLAGWLSGRLVGLSVDRPTG